MDKLNILSLHRMGDPRSRREAVRALEYMMPTYAKRHNCIVHDSSLPLPAHVKEIDFHAIILGPTFLCRRNSSDEFELTMIDYEWVKYSEAIKIALPQDDYYFSAILDRWMTDWGVDRVYTICPEHWDVLYPKYTMSGDLRLGYTGYISEQWVNPRKISDRTIDVSYRASMLPAYAGSVGILKGEIAARFVRAIQEKQSALCLDVSTHSKDLIPGHAWHEFLENSKFCLATPSGSSLLDPQGEYRKSIREYVKYNSDATFQEVAKACFPGKDRQYLFTMISPRNIEAALACTVQVATPGSYSGLMTSMESYIPLEEDCSNIKDVLEMMNDRVLVEKIRDNCKEVMLNTPALRFKNQVAEMIQFIKDHVGRSHIKGSSQEKMDTCKQRYEAEIEVVSSRFWRKYYMRESIVKVASKLGVRNSISFCLHLMKNGTTGR